MLQQYQIFGPKYFFLKTKMKSYNSGNIITYVAIPPISTQFYVLSHNCTKKSTLTQVVKIQETRQKIC
jgi:hypothetical protein